MPQNAEHSEVLAVGFQCSANEYREMVAAAEEDGRTLSEWIRHSLLNAVTVGRALRETSRSRH